MPDENKLAAMKELRFRVARCCSTCKHSTLHVASPWGNCRAATYEHKKHTEVTRQMPSHAFLCCDNYEFDQRVLEGLGGYLEGLRYDLEEVS
jgi:hypothetical protein